MQFWQFIVVLHSKDPKISKLILFDIKLRVMIINRFFLGNV